jgi:transposase
MTNNWLFFSGADISKLTIDITVRRNNDILLQTKIGNNAENIRDFIKRLRTLPAFKIKRMLIVMEHTGIYGNIFMHALFKAGAGVVVESGLKIMRSLGFIRGKNDAVDAERIAEYGYCHRDRLRLWAPKRPILDELQSLLSIRSRLINTKSILTTSLTDEVGFVSKKITVSSKEICKETILAMAVNTIKVDQEINKLWKADVDVKRKMEIMMSIPCIGEITALSILITTNEFKNFVCPKKFACYAGIAPFEISSGSALHRKARVSKLANKKMKTLLHICAMLSCRYVPEHIEYKERKINEGKATMSVLNAVRYKLILRIFSCIKQDRLYSEDYRTSKTKAVQQEASIEI